MFQVNGQSLVGATHPHAVRILKSAGNDVVAVISRPQTSVHCLKSDEPAVLVTDNRPVTKTQPSLTTSKSHTKTQQSAEDASNLPEPIPKYTDSRTAVTAKLADQQKCESKERLTVADSRTSLRRCPVSSGSRGTLRGTADITRSSSLSLAQQDNKKDQTNALSLQPFVAPHDSKRQDQVTCISSLNFLMMLLFRNLSLGALRLSVR